MGVRTARQGLVAAALLTIAISWGLSTSPAAAASSRLLLASVEGTQDVVVLDVARLQKWQRVRDWLEDPQASADPALRPWVGWAASLRSLPPEARLDAINRRVNATFRYASDYEIWGVRDYWETPAEVVAKGATDCEGFAIMKMWLARQAGFDPGGLELLVGILSRTAQMHAVLLAGGADRPFILDVLHAELMSTASFRDFRPILAADQASLSLFVSSASGSLLAGAGE